MFKIENKNLNFIVILGSLMFYFDVSRKVYFYKFFLFNCVLVDVYIADILWSIG